MRLAGIWYAEEGSEPMCRVEEIEAVPGGLEGDRYCGGSGYYAPFDVCEVTLVEREALEAVREETDIDLTDGRHRRNLVTEGVDLHDLLECRFRIGEATFEGTRPRPPCAHVEELAGESGVMRALAGGRGGICADVVEGGRLREGVEIELLESTAFDGEGLAERIRERHAER